MAAAAKTHDATSQELRLGIFPSLATYVLPRILKNPAWKDLGIDLRVSGRNLFTWTDYTGYDPEVNLGGAIQATRGMDYFTMPQTRAFLFSVTLNR